MVTRYSDLTFSRARQHTFQNDVLATITVARATAAALPAALGASSGGGGGGGPGHTPLPLPLQGARRPWAPLANSPATCCEHVDRLCLHLLRCLAVRTAPLAALNDFLVEWLEAPPGPDAASNPPRTSAAAPPPSLWRSVLPAEPPQVQGRRKQQPKWEKTKSQSAPKNNSAVIYHGI